MRAGYQQIARRKRFGCNLRGCDGVGWAVRSIIDAFRNLRGRPGRTALTVAGIAIGILALVVVGSLAERLHEIVGRSMAVNAGTVFAVIDEGVLMRGDSGEVRRAGNALVKLDGVAQIVPEVVLPYRSELGGGGRFGPPSLIFGFAGEDRMARARTLTLAAGRDARPGEQRVAVVGADFAASESVHAGDVIALYGSSYTVIGIYDKSFTLFDEAIVIPFADAQGLLAQTIPPNSPSLPHDGITAFLVLPKPGVDTGLLAARINTIAGLNARDPSEIAASVASTVTIFDEIVFGAALIALIVGAFSIVNTMTIAVAERTREIGIRKAIGARDHDVLGEFLIEAAAIGGAGGLAGIIAGALVVAYVDARSAGGGNLALFALSPRVVIGAFAFSVILSVVAGIIPAFSAARLAPTEALRRT
jgi:putative ABC transport system permease protein